MDSERRSDIRSGETGRDGSNSPPDHENSSSERRTAPHVIEPHLDHSDEDVPPPAYGESYGTINEADQGITTAASLTDDGRVNVRIDQKTRGLSSLLVPALRSQLDLLDTTGPAAPPASTPIVSKPGVRPPPALNVVIHVVGSRGDVQPFVALGKALKEQHGHRVRLATHPTFQKFVEENGLEFFSIGGDPSELMAFMVKNPGLMPGFDTLRSGDVGKRRKEIGIMVERCWRSCIEGGNGMDPDGSEPSTDDLLRTASESTSGEKVSPFVADAIIANPPSFAHIHCAEKLGIPLHMMFTMPWSPTRAFPHPLANIQSTDADTSMTNYLSYALVEMMTWQGLGDVINRFRHNKLNLEPITHTSAPALLSRLRIPYTYCWSPALIPKPTDWREYISISGFYFLSLASGYTPDPDLAAFLDAGPPPVYIGFGSIVLDDPDAMTKLIFDAVRITGQRALVSKGWGGFGADQIGIPEGVFMLGNVPHDWLFKHVSCVVHHGGAGTTAAGIACGKPTVVVPFFGDQPFWGAMVARAGAGPKPIPNKQLTAEKLAAAIEEALKPTSVEKAQELANRIAHEKGTEQGAAFFHQMLGADKLRCHLCPSRPAVWRIKRTQFRLSAFAATVLAEQGYLSFNEVKLYRPREYGVEDDPRDPITGATSALIGTTTSMTMGIADLPIAALKALKIHPDATKSTKAASPSPSRSPGESHKRSNSTSEKAKEISEETHKSGSRNSATDSLLRPPSTDAAISSQESSRASTPVPETTESADSVVETSQTPDVATNNASRQDATSPPPETATSKQKFGVHDAIGTGKGIWRVSSAGIRSPMDFTYQLARGFHNAPKLYGDDVREPEKITDLQSGLKAAGKGFGLGMADGISGLFTHPVKGAKKEGAAGFVKGFGKGLGGIVLKPSAAFWGIPGYTFKGIYKELRKHHGPGIENYVMAARTAQGLEEAAKARPEERTAVIECWKELRWYIKKKKTPGQEQLERIQSKHDATIAKLRDRSASWGIDPAIIPQLRALSRTETTMSDDSGVWSPVESSASSKVFLPEQKDEKPPMYEHEEDVEEQDLEEAIRRSVAETSKGDPEEDAMIERAIRVSLKELEESRAKGADADELNKAMEATIADAQRGIVSSRQAEEEDPSSFQSTGDSGGSMAEDDLTSVNDSGFASIGVGQEEEDLETAIKESKEAHDKTLKEDAEARREEEIVMQYMMKQSLKEEEMKRKAEESKR